MGSTTSATTPSSGSMQTSLLRWKSTRPSRRRLRACATRSSPSSTEPVEELQEALTWEAWEVELHQGLEPLVAKEVLDPLLRKWTNLVCNWKSEETSGTKADTAKSVLAVLVLQKK